MSFVCEGGGQWSACVVGSLTVDRTVASLEGEGGQVVPVGRGLLSAQVTLSEMWLVMLCWAEYGCPLQTLALSSEAEFGQWSAAVVDSRMARTVALWGGGVERWGGCLGMWLGAGGTLNHKWHHLHGVCGVVLS